ncbi:MAG TPA: hypothetical protein VN495_03785 [Candidatus Paceibacterota bacterium]|nr:hypothetical protein [Candidatus Paceibacterota bacterium]
MADEVNVEGVEYISSKRASQLSGYAQDYIGQLARASLIDARRIGGLWHVSLESLNAYKSNAQAYVPQPPQTPQGASSFETSVAFDGNEFISASHASKLSGYHQDYVTQLARGGKIPSRQIGNRWFVERKALIAHKSEKDGLLGSVQSESVGIKKLQPTPPKDEYTQSEEPFFQYTSESVDLLPEIDKPEEARQIKEDKEEDEYEFSGQRIAIRVSEPRETDVPRIYSWEKDAEIEENPVYEEKRWKISYKPFLVGGIILSLGAVGYLGYRILPSYGFVGGQSQTASGNIAEEALSGFSNFIENFFAREIYYQKGQ